jgi:uncharacterized protein (TIGR03437 family)
MNYRSLRLSALIGAAACVCFAQPNRILSRIDSARTVTLPGRVHPLANAGNDAGALESGFPMSLTLLLKPSAGQQSGLEQLLQDQQNSASASFHQWLTPEQYADRFGASPGDAARIAAWLSSQGFVVDTVARSRTFISFSGTSAQVEAAFGAPIHRYRVNGELHYANATDPRIPTALSGMVSGFRGMHDFHPKPHLVKMPQPHWNSMGFHQLAPDDFATIYDILPLYAAGINGSGQSVAIVGQSELNRSGSDATFFWNLFGFQPAPKLQLKLAGKTSPGVVPGDVDESSLDVEWAGAVARQATIYFVYSQDVWTSALYAVDNNVAPVLSMSYGNCEMYDLVDLPGNRQTVQQANAEGITWLAAAGDNGAADCDYGAAVAEGGLAVDAPGSIPEVTSMGGTMFNEGGSGWSANNSPTLESARGYLPEIAWNETALAGTLSATGGGVSVIFPQPSWQANIVPKDGMRHVPDISFDSGANHDPYYVRLNNRDTFFGGTSCAVPTMAGVVALLNQQLGSQGLGNINPVLYRMFQNVPKAFHDITGGDNIVPCAPGSPGCSNGQEGFSAGAGYDSVTGLGSLDVAQLVGQWSTQVTGGSQVVPSIDQNPVYETGPGQWTFQLTLTEEAGIAATLTGFKIGTVDHSPEIISTFKTSTIPARQSISGSYTLNLSSVPPNETFSFSGTDANGGAWSAAFTVPFQGPQAQLNIGGASNAASGQQAYAPGMIMAVYGTGFGSLAQGQAAATLPLPQYMAGVEALINNIPVPLYYVGPNQVNLQIPYEVSGPADLSLGNPYANVDYFFTVATVAPGIFMFPDGFVNPSRTAGVGQTVPLFITGDGKVSPTLADGVPPAPGTPLSQLPKPVQSVTVTVDGISSDVQFIGIPSWAVGVTQINFTIPQGVPSGRVPVVVTVGTTQSPPAYITIQ